MAPKTDKLKLLRVVVREDFSKSRADTFLRDLKATVAYLETAPKEVAAHWSKGDQHPSKRHAGSIHMAHLGHKCVTSLSVTLPLRSAPFQPPPGCGKNANVGILSANRLHHESSSKHSLAGKHGKTHAVC